MSLVLALAPLLGLAVQELSCAPTTDTASTEKYVFFFRLPENRQELPWEGTLRLPSEMGRRLEDEAAADLNLFHIPETDEDAAQGLVRYEARGAYSTFTIILSSDYLGKPLNGFLVDFEIRNLDDHIKWTQTLTCDAIVSEI